MGYHLPTYGEAHTKVKLSLTMVDGVFKGDALPKCRPRMSRKEASAHYSKKFSNYWDEMFKTEFPNKADRHKIIRAICTNSLVYRRFCSKKGLCDD